MAQNSGERDCIARHEDYRPLDEDIAGQDFQQRRVRAVAALVKPGERVLDVGCNSGYFLSYVPGCEVHGIDVSERAVEVARTRLASAQVGKAEALPFPDKSFDVVVVSEILEHVHDADLVMREATRVARRAVIGSTPHEDSDAWGPGTVEHHPYHVRCFTLETLSDLLSQVSPTFSFDTVSCNGLKQCYVFQVEVGQ